MNGGSFKQATLWSVCSREAERRTRKTVAITVLAPITTLIISLPSGPSGMRYAYFLCTKLDQCKYVIQIIPGVQV